MLSKWQSTLSELEPLSQVKLSLCYFTEKELEPSTIQLHSFSDASRQAYAATVYLRSEWDGMRVQVELVASKTKVAPLKKQSIPRLELLAATILARLMNTVQTSLPSEIKNFYWTDSTNALCWITNNKPWKQYVQHRVQEIRQQSPKKRRYFPGPETPADLPSRGLNGNDLVNCKLWCNGPEFLRKPECEWPEYSTLHSLNETSAKKNDQTTANCYPFPRTRGS